MTRSGRLRRLSVLHAGVLVMAMTSGCFALFTLDSYGPAVTTDAGVSSDASAPDSDAAASCDPSTPFDAPTPVVELNTSANEHWIAFSPDERTGYLVRGTLDAQDDGRDIYVVSRNTLTAGFGEAQPIAEVNTGSDDDNPTLTVDDLELYFHSTRSGGQGGADIYTGRRASTKEPFTVSPVAPLNSTRRDADPFVLPDGSMLFFDSNRDGPLRIYQSKRAGDTFGEPTIVRSLATESENVVQPVLSNDGLILYFGSDVKGSFDVWMATRATVADDFGAPVEVAELASPDEDYPSWLSPDRCRLYLVSARSGGSGGRDLWLAQRTPR